jgi:threonine/homoserine/homoserine lactone efflux protein
MQFFLQAFGIGFLLSVMIGPVFFVLLETSITKGIKSALVLDFGVLISDVMYVLFAAIFVDQLKSLDSGDNKIIFGFVGGSIFIGYGLYNLFKKKGDMNSLENPEVLELTASIAATPSQTKDYFLLGLKGFLLNLANPLVIFYWMSVMSLATQVSPANSLFPWEFLFVCIVIITFFGIDVLKIFAAKKLRPLVTPNLLNALNRLIGIIFSLFGIFLILQNFIKYL